MSRTRNSDGVACRSSLRFKRTLLSSVKCLPRATAAGATHVTPCLISYEVDALIFTPILQTKKLSIREVNELAPGCSESVPRPAHQSTEK